MIITFFQKMFREKLKWLFQVGHLYSVGGRPNLAKSEAESDSYCRRSSFDKHDFPQMEVANKRTTKQLQSSWPGLEPVVPG